MLQTPTSSVRDSVAAAQKKKSIKSSLGRLFSKKEKVNFDTVQSIFICSLQLKIQYFLSFSANATKTGEGREGFDARRIGQHDVHERIVTDQ